MYQKQVYLPYQAIAASTTEDYVFGLRAAAKSIAAVVDIGDILRTSGAIPSIEAARELDSNALEETLGLWFREQVGYVSQVLDQLSLAELPVSEILRQLEERLGSATGLP